MSHPIPTPPSPIRRRLHAVLAVVLLLTAFVLLAGRLGLISPRYAFWARNTNIDFAAAQERLDSLMNDGASLDPSLTKIVIRKASRELELWNDTKLLKTYRIALGHKPEGPKTRKGDGRTPEGDYFICTELDRSSFHLFLGLNYPNASDARTAHDAGAITQDQLDSFVADAEAERQPDWSTSLGGAIGIHGGGTFRDWTLGCIALENNDIEEIWLAVRLGTPVSIQP